MKRSETPINKISKVVTSQPAPNIPGVFPQCCNGQNIQGTFRKNLNGKVVVVLKVFDLIITNGDLLANFSNYEVIFP